MSFVMVVIAIIKRMPYVVVVIAIMKWMSHVILFVCLFVCLSKQGQFFSYLASVTSASDRAANLDLCLAMAFSSEGSFTCHTYCDAGPRFIRSHPKVWHLHPTMALERGSQFTTHIPTYRPAKIRVRIDSLYDKVDVSRNVSYCYNKVDVLCNGSKCVKQQIINQSMVVKVMVLVQYWYDLSRASRVKLCGPLPIHLVVPSYKMECKTKYVTICNECETV
jgi:hypothetical protein